MRSPHDREILRIAVPALGALASEPLYVLVDTAIVGHIGTTELTALALAGTVLTTAYTLFNFLTYGTTAQVARLHGSGRPERAAGLGMQAFWLGLGIGSVLLLALVALAGPAVALMGAQGRVAEEAETYLRISALGAPAFMLAACGQGYLRGISDLRTPLVILVIAQVVNAVLEVVFVYGFGWGLEGSAWGTVVAQCGMGLAFARVQARGGWERPRLEAIKPLMRVGSEIAVRTSALVGSFLIATAVLGRINPESVSAHQIVFQLFIFIALVLDAIAIAGQVIVGRLLGAGDLAAARAAGRRMIGWSTLAGVLFAGLLLGLDERLPRLFTSDPAVIERADEIWLLFALTMPANAAVFALDGILIGAGDTRYLMWGMLAAAVTFIALSILALDRGWGIEGVWWGLVALIAVRLATCGARFAGDAWLTAGLRRGAHSPA